MNKMRMLALQMTLCLGLPLTAVAPVLADDAGLKLTTDNEKLSYVLGMGVGASFKRMGPQQADIDLAIVMQAAKDVMEGKTPLVDEAEATQIRKGAQQKIQQWRAEEAKAEADRNRAEGQAFLAKNKERPGVVTTASGLQYEVITQGTGEKPKADDMVSVHYRGTLIDGTEFDSSARRGKPATFPVNGVIPGWTEALQLMPVGSKYRLYIPGELAYGDRKAGKQIGPQATLIFEVELLNMTPSKEEAAAAAEEAAEEKAEQAAEKAATQGAQ